MMKQLPLFKESELPKINYLVRTQGFSGYKETGCATIEEVEKAMGLVLLVPLFQ